uniref:WD and tetratricopeptide repeats protein 1-like n=1 Tax=Hirondellea gigas TaxID=1518452 RepID=A0A2P2I7M8_9CRUS
MSTHSSTSTNISNEDANLTLEVEEEAKSSRNAPEIISYEDCESLPCSVTTKPSSNGTSDTHSTSSNKWPATVPPMLIRNKRTSLPKLQMNRLIGRTTRASVEKQCQLSRDLINRLGVSAELHGHSGCVNCIEFNDTGRLLVSGSDDDRLILWDVYSHKKLRTYSTSHTGNIFSVKFLPSCGTGLLVSGAGDKKVEVRDLETSQLLHTCTCHTNRVKRIATSPHLQNTFFSAGEDGTVLQYDLRTPHPCDGSSSNVVVDLRPLRAFGYPLEVKCVALSPRDPYKLAVGANDPFVRIYDRRMIKLTKMQSSGMGPPSSGGVDGGGEGVIEWDPDHLPPGCCQYFVPGHLPSSYRELQRKFRSLATTYLSYSPDGRHLLANLGGENIYLYDTDNVIAPVRYTAPPSSGSAAVYASTSGSAAGSSASSSLPSNGFTCAPTNGYHTPGPRVALPKKAELLKASGNEKFRSKSWVAAVMQYSEALQYCPTSPELFSNRAAALMHRNWEGDTYAALRDCFRALAQDPRHPNAYHRMASCLQKLGRTDEARACIEDFKSHNTEFTHSSLCSRLYTSILDDVFQNSVGANGSSGSVIGGNSHQHHNGANGTASGSSKTNEDLSHAKIVQQEQKCRSDARDYLSHYAGHCNTTTDIKEAVFLGQSGDFIAAGSDDGNLFVWETATGNVVRLMPADENIVNCVQCHPSASLLATSGIGHTVKLWEPTANSALIDEPEMEQATRLNQTRMNADPLEMLFMHMGDLATVFNTREGIGHHHGPGRLGRGVVPVFRRLDDGYEEEEDDDDAPVPQHAFEFLRIPRPGGGGGDDAAAAALLCALSLHYYYWWYLYYYCC